MIVSIKSIMKDSGPGTAMLSKPGIMTLKLHKPFDVKKVEPIPEEVIER